MSGEWENGEAHGQGKETNPIDNEEFDKWSNYVKEASMVDAEEDIGVFTGQTRDDKPHGKGTMEYSDGRIYAGDWYQGRWHGCGCAKFANGDCYEGSYFLGFRHGMGRERRNNGYSYEGIYFFDERHGLGTIRWINGDSYEVYHYFGTRAYRWNDGSDYTGKDCWSWQSKGPVAGVSFEEKYLQGSRKIRSGTFSTVFAGTDRASGKAVAIKVIDRSKMQWGGRDALRDEIENLKTLQGGPHIVELYDVYMPNSEECFLVMECLRGGELFDRILEKKRFSEAEARQVARGLLEALQYMHSQNIAFRDVKLENILLEVSDTSEWSF